MTRIGFHWLHSMPLADELRAARSSASLSIARHGRPDAVTLWRPEGGGLRILSRMHDLEERVEVGVLAFDLVSEPVAGERFVVLPPEFNSSLRVKKLMVVEGAIRAESGVVLEGSSGGRIVVVAGANPYSLAIRGVVEMEHVYEPEYPERAYVAAEMQD